MNGMRNGTGKLIMANGNIYEGSFEKNKFNGYGKLELDDKTYNGEWKDN